MDGRCAAASYEDYRDGPFLTTAGMRWFLDHYLCGEDGAIDDPRVSPLLADDAAVAKSPPTLVITAEIDGARRRRGPCGAPATGRRPRIGVAVRGHVPRVRRVAEYMEDGQRAIREAGAALRTALGD